MGGIFRRTQVRVDYVDLHSFESPTQMMTAINDLQKEKTLLIEKQGTLSSEITRLKAALDASGAETTEAKKEVELWKAQFEDTKDALQWQEKLLSAAKKEKDGLKSLLDSYNAEDAMNSNYDKTKTARISELEATMAVKDQQIMEMQKREQLRTPELELLRSENAKLEKQVS